MDERKTTMRGKLLPPNPCEEQASLEDRRSILLAKSLLRTQSRLLKLEAVVDELKESIASRRADHRRQRRSSLSVAQQPLPGLLH
jgi:hypothetical protein